MASPAIASQSGFTQLTSQSGTGPFAFTVTHYSKADLTVYIGETPLAQSAWSLTSTSVSGADFYSGGSVTLNSAITSKDVTIALTPAAKRTSMFGSGGLAPRSLDNALNAIVLKQISLEKDMARALIAPYGESGVTFVPTDVTALASIKTEIETLADMDVELAAIYAIRDAVSGVYARASAVDEIHDALPNLLSLLQERTVANVAALKELTSDIIDNDDKVTTWGAVTRGKGGAVFRVLAGSAASNGLTPDGWTIVENNDGDLTFKIDYVGAVNIEWFGSVNDGVTDDSEAVELARQTGKSIYFPMGTSTFIAAVSDGGTEIGELTSKQSLVTDPAPTWHTTISTAQTFEAGALATQSAENGVGPGLRILGVGSIRVFDIVNCRKFVIAEGAYVPIAHQVARLGRTGAAQASYIFYNFGDVSQQNPFITLTGVTGTPWTEGEDVEGDTSGATAVVVSYDAGTGALTLKETSSTPFSVSETATGQSSGASGTVSVVYNPDHIFEVENHAGDFWSRATVEGAYAASADGLHVSTNTYTRFDEVRIEKYFSRCNMNVNATDARIVNVHISADMEGALVNTIRFYVTTSTTKGIGDVGFENVYLSRMKCSVLRSGGVGVYLRSERSGASCGNVDGHIVCADEHTTHGALIWADVGTITGVAMRVSGSINPATTGQYAIYVIEGSGTIDNLDLSVHVRNGAGTALGAMVYISGSPSGRIGPLVGTGTITKDLIIAGTQPANLRIDVSESGLPIGGRRFSPDWTYINLPTGANDNYGGRGGASGVQTWTADRDIRIVGSSSHYNGTPTADELDFAIEVDGVLVKGHTNEGDTAQVNRYWPTGYVDVSKGSVVKIYWQGTASYATANIDAVGNFEFIDLWEDAA